MEHSLRVSYYSYIITKALLIHCGGRRAGIADRIDEVHKNILKEARGVPFIVPFTFGEYGYDEHSANICGGLMLSFTAFGKN